MVVLQLSGLSHPFIKIRSVKFLLRAEIVPICKDMLIKQESSIAYDTLVYKRA